MLVLSRPMHHRPKLHYHLPILPAGLLRVLLFTFLGHGHILDLGVDFFLCFCDGLHLLLGLCNGLYLLLGLCDCGSLNLLLCLGDRLVDLSLLKLSVKNLCHEQVLGVLKEYKTLNQGQNGFNKPNDEAAIQHEELNLGDLQAKGSKGVPTG